MCHHPPHPIPPFPTLSMSSAPTAETSQVAADRKAAEVAWVAADHEAVAADSCATAIAEATRLVAAADKLEADAACAWQEATRAHAALAAASPPEDSSIVPPPTPRNDNVFRAYSAAQAHAAVAALHAQAVSVLNVKAMIPIFLNNLSPHYNWWKTLFLNMLSNYEHSDHVLIDVTPDVIVDPHWRQMDCIVRSWLYGTIAPNLIEVASTPHPTARSLWLGLEE
jgi:hypothetical protein